MRWIVQFDQFFSWLDQNVGLNNVWLALTADHGIAPVAGEAAKLGMNSAMVNMVKLYARLEEELNQRYSPGAKVDYLMPGPELPYIVLNKHAFEKAHIEEQAAEEELAALLAEAVAAQNPAPMPMLKVGEALAEPSQHRLPPSPQVAAVYTRLQMAGGHLPQTELGSRNGAQLRIPRELVCDAGAGRVSDGGYSCVGRHDALQSMVV